MEPSWTIRIATPDDAAALQSLLEVSYPVLMAPAYDTATLEPALALMTKARRSLLESDTYYVAETQDGQVIGSGGWTPAQPDTGRVIPDVGHIRHFATHPEWTGRGIGRAIYERCEAGARAAGIAWFECYSSLNGEPFYTALGFERVEKIDVELRPGIQLPSVSMRRRI